MVVDDVKFANVLLAIYHNYDFSLTSLCKKNEKENQDEDLNFGLKVKLVGHFILTTLNESLQINPLLLVLIITVFLGLYWSQEVLYTASSIVFIIILRRDMKEPNYVLEYQHIHITA